MEQLELPQGMSIIARTAGIGRNVEELQWDLSYLLQLWTAIDGAARDNSAPILIYLESSLVIRAIRDYFSPEIGEILIDTDEIADQATAFMSVVMPDNVQRVKRYRDDIPLFSRFQIEHQIETAYSRTVQLPSGGAVVIDHTEALVSVDVNSARSTRGADIEETALRTNVEAADEVARQLRLRDLGGLIVIDFIDMEDSKNQRAVEQRLRDALHFDRARVQMGKISRFGLMELSRQPASGPERRLAHHLPALQRHRRDPRRGIQRPARPAPAAGRGHEGKHRRRARQVPVDVATYLLNEKRSDITKMEARLKVNLLLIPNKHLETPHHHIERLRHDDPRLEEVTSFELVEAPSTDAAWQPREHEIKSRPEALVKGITPSQPAPVSTPAPAPPPRRPCRLRRPGRPVQAPGRLADRQWRQRQARRRPAAQEDTAKRGASGRGRAATTARTAAASAMAPTATATAATKRAATALKAPKAAASTCAATAAPKASAPSVRNAPNGRNAANARAVTKHAPIATRPRWPTTAPSRLSRPLAMTPAPAAIAAAAVAATAARKANPTRR